jgi:hypothetical protein
MCTTMNQFTYRYIALMECPGSDIQDINGGSTYNYYINWWNPTNITSRPFVIVHIASFYKTISRKTIQMFPRASYLMKMYLWFFAQKNKQPSKFGVYGHAQVIWDMWCINAFIRLTTMWLSMRMINRISVVLSPIEKKYSVRSRRREPGKWDSQYAW